VVYFKITLMLETVSTSETSIIFCETTWRNVPEDSHLQLRQYIPTGKRFRAHEWRCGNVEFRGERREGLWNEMTGMIDIIDCEIGEPTKLGNPKKKEEKKRCRIRLIFSSIASSFEMKTVLFVPCVLCPKVALQGAILSVRST
jgi:hypothetical protein